MDIFDHQDTITTEEFLKDYWQKKPLLIRQAFPDFESPITADELAGLSLEEEIESRLIIYSSKDRNNGDWELKHGPFEEDTFSKLPGKNWTLLVQGSDTLVPDIAQLLESFKFLPSWRLDDIMISYATDQGSVGPHFDHYDVFLLQAEGERLWKVGDFCDQDPNNKTLLEENCDLSLTKEFSTQQEWLLKPGDMLYLPPKLAHWGIAQGECMTFSIGFRAPKVSEMISAYCDERLQRIITDDFYQDPDDLFENQNTPGRISGSALAKIKAMILNELESSDHIAQWFGKHITTPRYETFFQKEHRDCYEEFCNLPTETVFYRQDGCRFSYSEKKDLSKNSDKNKDLSYLFINGEQFIVNTFLASLLCDQPLFSAEELKSFHGDDNKTVIQYLFNNELIQILEQQ